MVYAVIFAGGVGRRMARDGITPDLEQGPVSEAGADVPKQFLSVNGSPIILRTLAHFEAHPGVDGIVVACLSDWIPRFREMLRESGMKKVMEVVPGGDTGYLSIHNGLMALRDRGIAGEDTILVCDGVRPVLTPRLISEAIETAEKYGTAVPVMPSIDSLLYSEDGQVSRASHDRNRMFITQAPQGYRAEKLLWAHEEAEKRNWHDAVSSSELLIQLGEEVHLFPGERNNIKITTKDDLVLLMADDLYREQEKRAEKNVSQ